MEVARAGAAADPPVEPPRSLRPILRFRRPLPASALEAVRRTIDDDAAFRERVAAAAVDVGADRLGAAGQLFLTRPEGWAEDLAGLEAEADAAAGAADEAAEERSARKRLRLVEDAAKRAEELAASLRAELAARRTELADERRARQEAEERAEATATRVRGLERERDAAHRRAAALDAELARVRADLAAAEERVADATVVAAPASVVADPPGRDGPQEDGPPTDAPPDPPAPFAVDQLRAAIAGAGEAAAALGRSLEAAARALRDEPRGATGVLPASSIAGDRRRPVGANRRARSGRLPVALPPGLFDDDPSAADHLVRVRGCVLVVDGYNASLRRWPDLPIAEQRRRLVDALAGLAARCGASVQIVFDGDDEAAHARSLARRGVQVRFSARDVEADEVILEQVDRLPETSAVVVATDDRRVRREAAARGANVIGQDQLFALL